MTSEAETPAASSSASGPRADGRAVDELRPITITRGWSAQAEGSALIEFGQTRVLCTASVTEGVPVPDGVWLSGVRSRRRPGTLTGPRTGVSGAGGSGEFPWRFWHPGEPSVSPYRAAAARRRPGTVQSRPS